ncbi:MAG: IstB domain protein ATP-binding protein [Mesotoga infera]|jgi:DNA replication protein DnaC|uniref:IstB domain protein ATP-binding protein n=1 Tax=Mesotoga infera TaxID=1236046 RepID=A0A124FZR6_9BACT|nr:MAG: IstB domain protein ATP-binding protein [Mesotoga infera]
MSARIEELCRTLRLSGLAASVRDLEPSPCSEEINAFLLHALENEYELRLERKRVNAVRTAGFPTMKRFDDLVVDLLPEDARSYLSLLKDLEFLKEHQNVLMVGNSGTGKTHLAIAIGVLACEQNYRVIFKTTAGLVNELVEAKQERRLTYLLRQLKRVDLLVLDELGYITFDLAGAELLFQLLASRYETASTLVTSNLMFSEWVKVFHDKSLTAALLDRITHRALVLNMTGTSFRQR